MNPYLEPSGFLGTGASLLADVTLLAYLLLIIPSMILGLIFARRKLHRPHHQWTMILVTIVNWVLIIFLMFAAYRFDVAPNISDNPDNSRYLLPALHGLLGIPAQLLATYVVFRMLREDAQVARAKRRGEKDTSRYWFKSAKPVMRLTLILWLLTATLGVVTYLTRYGVIPAVNISIEVAAPIATEEIRLTEATEASAVDAPIATEEIEATPAPDIAATQEASASDQTAEPPIATEELPPAPTRTRRVPTPVATAEPPAATEEIGAPVETPELNAPVETPEVSVGEEFRVEGTVEAVGSIAVIVDGQRYDISNARIDDPLRVGLRVRVEGQMINGVAVVERIRAEDD